MLTVLGFLIVSAFICTLVSAIGRCPLWVPTLLLCVVALLQVLPLK